ncbi:MAG: NAD(P)-dependent oxidoreductase [Pseudomonadota bacterium]
MTRVLAITGATGFVGSAVLDAAAAEGLEVRALARRDQPEREGVTWVQGTLEDAEALEELITGADAVIHIAGLTNTPEPAEFETANVAGTQNMIAATKAAGVKRFVFVSSLSAREPDLSAYGASKARAETLVEASGLDWTTVRPPAVYGPRDTDMFELFRSAKFGFVPLPPRGATSIIHADDLARLLLILATHALHPSTRSLPGDHPGGRVEGVGGLVRHKMFEPDDGREGGWSHKELAKAIGKAVGRPVFAPHLPASVLDAAAQADRMLRRDKAKLTPDRVGYMCHPNWVVRSQKAVPEKVWQPRISGEEGLSATAKWYRDDGWL